MKFIVPIAALLLCPFASRAAETAATPPSAAPQLALKQDFERADSIGQWRQQTPKDAKPNALTLDNKEPHAGNSALKYEILDAGEKERYIFSGAKLPANTDAASRTLRIRLFARTAPQPMENQEFTFRVLERDASNPTGWLEGTTDVLKIEPSTDWKEYAFTGKLAPKTEGLTLYIVAKKPRPGQIVWIDDLSVEVVPVTVQNVNLP